MFGLDVGSDSLGQSSWLFTGALYNGYGPPAGFCFDIFCDDDPIMDDPRMHDYNKDKKVADFIAAVNDQVTRDDGGVKQLKFLFLRPVAITAKAVFILLAAAEGQRPVNYLSCSCYYEEYSD